MAVVTARTSPEPTVVGPILEYQIGSGLICGEDIRAGAACYIASDGLVMMSGGSGVTAIGDAGAKVHGFAPRHTKVAQGDPITLMSHVEFAMTAASGLTPGENLYLDVSAATKGRLNTSQGFLGLPPCAFAIDDTRARVFHAVPFANPVV